MNRKDAKEYVIEHSTELLQKDGSGKGYICPICHSGSGNKGTGITTKDGGKHFTCWAGDCFRNTDIIDIIGLQYGLTDYLKKLEKCTDLLGIHLDGGSHSASPSSPSQAGKPSPISQPKKATPKEKDFTDFFLQAAGDLNKTDYHRGISLDTLRRFNVGYVENWKPTEKTPASPRLIIPTSPYSYLARDTRTNLTEKQKAFSKKKEGALRIFNGDILKTTKQPVFIVEGEIDALSIIDVGGEAVGLGGTSGVDKLLDLIRTLKPSCHFIAALDNDEAGQKATEKLTEGLQALNASYHVANVTGGYKDANEALNKDPVSFTEAIRQQTEEGLQRQKDRAQAEEEAKAEALEALKQKSAYNALLSFSDRIQESAKASCYPTGFYSLDKILDGGLYAGLYVVGAISSLGKTTFCLQVADNIAAHGEDVIIFSLEMAKEELIAKSLSRYTFTINEDRGGDPRKAKTTRGLLAGGRYENYTDDEMELITDAMETYSLRNADNIYIEEGIGDVDINRIRARIEDHVAITGKAPVVLIDYLQIIAPADPHATDKQNTDKAITELKRISRDYKTPVIGISSFNRENYTAPVNLSSFKESGAIEYSSDVLIGLQYQGMDYIDGEKEGERTTRIRKLREEAEEKGRNGKAQDIEVKILKNRNGSKGKASLFFYPMFNYFTEEDAEEAEQLKEEQATQPEGWTQTTHKKPL